MSNGNSGGGWNRPTSNQPTAKKGGTKSPSLMKGVIVGAVAVVVGIVCIFAFSGKSEKPVKDTRTKPEKIKEVTPAKAQTNKVAVAEKPKELKPQQVGETRNGYVLLPSGKLHKVRPTITNHTIRAKSKCEIFNHDCENEIAVLLTLKPGNVIVGTPHWNGQLTKDFLKSLSEPIIVSQDDTPEQAELKRAVTETKIELKEAYDRGEDIEKILLDARADLQKLMYYRQDVQGMVMRYKLDHPEASQQDVEDICAAANKMLESKGIAPAVTGPITRQRIKMMRNQMKANETNGGQR